MESTLGASGMLGAIGSLAQSAPAQKTRRGRGAGGSVASRSISGLSRSSSRHVVVEEQRTSAVYPQGAVVESMSDVELFELVLAGDQHAFAVLVDRYKYADHCESVLI